jgi:hypothetical protein
MYTKWKQGRYVERVVSVSEMRNAFNILIGKPDKTWLLWTPRPGWEDGTKINLKNRDMWEDIDWIRVVLERLQWRALWIQ